MIWTAVKFHRIYWWRRAEISCFWGQDDRFSSKLITGQNKAEWRLKIKREPSPHVEKVIKTDWDWSGNVRFVYTRAQTHQAKVKTSNKIYWLHYVSVCVRGFLSASSRIQSSITVWKNNSSALFPIWTKSLAARPFSFPFIISLFVSQWPKSQTDRKLKSINVTCHSLKCQL